MSTYKLSFEQIRQDPGLSDMLSALERGFQQFGIDYYLVGAVSRDVWMAGINKITPTRTTGDIDFAVLINDKGVYEVLKEYLVKEEGFSPYNNNAFVLIYKDGTEVDLLPFGEVEDTGRSVTVIGSGYNKIHVDGFKEVYENRLPEIEVGNHKFKFCSLPGIVLLKMIAWNDRPESRPDDILDLSDILKHYFDMNSENIYENHLDLFEQEDFELLDVSATVIGREIRNIVIRSTQLYERIRKILEDNSKGNNSRMAEIMTRHFDNTIEENVRLIQRMKTGIEDDRS